MVNEHTVYRWERAKRVTVYDSSRRARYPSITKASDGSLLVLFTHQTEEQENKGVADLKLMRSTDGGKTWSSPSAPYESMKGEPRAFGTMTTARDGRIIVPFAEFRDGQTSSTFRMLVSDDHARTWDLLDPPVKLPLTWWAPAGKLVEVSNGTWVMPVYGAATEQDLKATIHGCGLLRSTDGGRSWGDFGWIAKGRGEVVGAAPDRRFSFQGPSVQPFANGRWLAMVMARRLNKAGDGPTRINEGPGSPHLLCRLWSTDQGRTWTRPDQLAPGAWPTLASVNDNVMCVNTIWATWGQMRLMVSRDGFESFFQEMELTQRGWLRGMHNRPQEVPLPPTVPHLADAWSFEHYGFPSALALDQDNMVVVFGRPQRGEGQIEGAANQRIPYEKERIQAVFYHRVPIPGELAEPIHPKRPDGRWVLVDRITVPVNGVLAQTPNGDLIGPVGGAIKRSSDGGRTWQEVKHAKFPEKTRELSSAFSVMRSGRWLVAVIKDHEAYVTGHTTQVGSQGGYPIFKLHGWSIDWSVVVSYSDDEGRTWHKGEPFKGPLKWACPSTWHFIETADGTVWLPLYGCATDEEADSYSGSNCIVRSHDGGKTWGDPSFVFLTNPKGPDDYQSEPRYSEMDIVQLANGHLLAFSRNEYIVMGPRGWGGTEMTVSTDGGRTWQKTGSSLSGVSQQTGVVLPDGGIAFTYRSHSWQQPGVAISYDEGRSFSYMLGGPYETINAFLTAEDEFVVFTAVSPRSDASAGVYRWVSHK